MKNKNVIKKSSLEVTLEQREHYNPYQTGTGIHENPGKYPNRNKRKANLRKELANY